MSFHEDLLKGIMGGTAVGAGINALISRPTTTVRANPPLAPSALETAQMQLNMAQQIANLREAGYDVQFQPNGSISLTERQLRPEEQLTRATRGTAQGSVLAQLMRDEANPLALRDQLGSALMARRMASTTGRKGIDRVGLIRSIMSRQGGGMPGVGQQGGTTIAGGAMPGLGGTTIPPLSSQPQGGGKTSSNGGSGSNGLGTALGIASPLLGGGLAIAKHFGLFGPRVPSAPPGTDPATGLRSSEFTLPTPSFSTRGLGGGLAPGVAEAFPGGVPSVFSEEFANFAGPGADLGLDVPLGVGIGGDLPFNAPQIPATEGGGFSLPGLGTLGNLAGLGAGIAGLVGGGPLSKPAGALGTAGSALNLAGITGLEAGLTPSAAGFSLPGLGTIGGGIGTGLSLAALPFVIQALFASGAFGKTRAQKEGEKQIGFARSYGAEIQADPEAWANRWETRFPTGPDLPPDERRDIGAKMKTAAFESLAGSLTMERLRELLDAPNLMLSGWAGGLDNGRVSPLALEANAQDIFDMVDDLYRERKGLSPRHPEGRVVEEEPIRREREAE